MKIINYTILLLSLISCDKPNHNQLRNVDKNSPSIEQEMTNNLRTSGEEIYYSIDNITNQIYKLKIKYLNNGAVEIDRKINNGNHNGQQVTFLNQINEGVNYALVDSSIIEIDSDSILNTYLIPFIPTDSIQAIIAGGPGGYRAECRCSQAVGTAPSCQANVSKAANGAITYDCIAKNCSACKLRVIKIKDKKVKGSELVYNYSGGFIILTANSIVEK